MEEKKNFEVSGPEEPKKNGSKKGLVICLILILILAIAGGAIYYFFFNKSTKLQLSDKDKITNSLDKVEVKLAEITEGYKPEQRKIAENLTKKPFKGKYTVSGKINELNVDGVNNQEFETSKQLLNNTSIVVDSQGNFAEGKIYAELKALGQQLGNIVITKDVMAAQVPMAESRYYTIFKNSLETSNYKEFAEIFNVIDSLGKSSYNLDDMKLSDKEQKHFEDTYGKVIKNYVTDDKISKEASEVNGKKCDKVTYTIDNDTFKNILKDYITTFKNDKEGQNIIFDKYLGVIYSTGLGEKYIGMSKEQLKSQVLSMIDNTAEQAISGINNVKIDKAEIVVYATATETYKMEFAITIQNQTAKFIMDFKDKEIDLKLLFDNQDMMTATIKNENGAVKVVANIQNMANIELTAKEDKNGSNYVIKMKTTTGRDDVNFEISSNTKVNEDTATKLAGDTELNVKLEFDGQKADLTLKFNSEIEIVDSITIPEVTAANSIDVVKEGYLDSLMKNFGGSSLTTPSYNNYNFNTTTPSYNNYNFNTINTTNSLNGLSF